MEGTGAAALLDKNLGSVRMGLASPLAFYKYLPKEQGAFSFRDWTRQAMQTEAQKALFVTYRERDLESVRSLLAFIVGVIINTAVDTREGRQPIWLIVDELAGLGEIPALLSGAAKLRKTGVRLVVGIQDYDQVENLYGRSRAASITNNLDASNNAVSGSGFRRTLLELTALRCAA